MKKHIYVKRVAFIMILAVCSLFLFAGTVISQDVMRQNEVKWLRKEAEDLFERGSYDEAIKKYNKAIKLTRDKDITLFLKNAREEVKEKKREEKKRLKELAKRRKKEEKAKRKEKN